MKRTNIIIVVTLMITVVLFLFKPLHAHYSCGNNCCSQRNIQKHLSSATGTYDQNPLLHSYDISFYKLDVHFEPDQLYIEGTVTIFAMVTSGTIDTIVFELKENMIVHNIDLDGESTYFEHNENEIHIIPSSALKKDQYFEAKIEYSGSPDSPGFFSGMNSGYDQYGEPVLWTLSEPVNARQWFPCKQVLEDKIDSVHVFVTTSDDYIAASNGLLNNIVELPNDKVRYEWKSYYPIAYYLIAVTVGNYQEYNFYAPINESGDSVLVQNYIYNHPEALPKYKEDIDQTKELMLLFSGLYGDYPFAGEKYGHVMAPMGGGMEHQTISTMHSFSYTLTAHELAHHWFGNNVTCATWNDIWINEGFASYSEYLARQFLKGQDEADKWMEDVHGYVTGEPGGSVYVPDDETNDVYRIFNGRLSYDKGAAILHILRFEIDDDEMYFDIFKEFQSRHMDSVATGDDFKNVVEDITLSSWDWFFEQWYYGEGHPRFDIEYSQKNDTVFIGISQKGSAGDPVYFKTSAEIQLIGERQDTVVRFFQSSKNQLFSYYFPDNLRDIVFDPDNWLLKELNSVSMVKSRPALLSVFPNPVVNNIIIEGYANGYGNLNVEVFDSQGKIYYNTILPTNGGIIYTSDWLTGLYILNVSDNKKNLINKKIIKID